MNLLLIWDKIRRLHINFKDIYSNGIQLYEAGFGKIRLGYPTLEEKISIEYKKYELIKNLPIVGRLIASIF
ncbi:hypothetical protein NCWK1_0231 [Nostoc cycadae WK-1]|uniref:Uncharacterized protein n=1 Tax=Nostoc cycadae WK-1 TaxID=1861711 RepID=A0A2H6LBB7_9NOSO|nr:hypothetical protein NCWK1_0231 [Nostoc cycadae WK-1]